MPRADKSLRQHLTDLSEPLEITEGVAILTDIATALSDIDSRIVHRDLKPENVLLLDGAWCLADFGISRYAEASTAPDTQKYSLSPPYAGPERWRTHISASDPSGFKGSIMISLRRSSTALLPRSATVVRSASSRSRPTTL